jgi:hypothetical protein
MLLPHQTTLLLQASQQHAAGRHTRAHSTAVALAPHAADCLPFASVCPNAIYLPVAGLFFIFLQAARCPASCSCNLFLQAAVSARTLSTPCRAGARALPAIAQARDTALAFHTRQMLPSRCSTRQGMSVGDVLCRRLSS